MDDFLKIVEQHKLGDLASILGVLISVCGFAVTVIAVCKSKSAADRAQSAAESTHAALNYFETVSKISSAITSMSEIKRLHRVEAWGILPDRYSSVRQELVLIRSSNPNLESHHKAALQGAIEQFSELESVVETSLSYPKKTPLRASKLNEIVSSQIDKMNELHDAVKQQTNTSTDV